MSHVKKRIDHSSKKFFIRTIAAQIHLASALGAIVGLIVLLGYAQKTAGTTHYMACLVYGVTGILVFVASSLFHFLEDGFEISPRLARILEDLDFISIYLFIAGTYTPILLNTLSDPWKFPLLGFIWFLALSGITYTLGKAKLPRWAQHRAVSTGLYVLMGWMLVFKLNEIVSNMSHLSLSYLLKGSLSYSIGAIIFATKRPILFKDLFGSHEIWHILVTIGFGYHYFMILNMYAH